MKSLLILFSLVAFASVSNAVTYNGNGNSSFGGPVGNGTLTFTDNGTTLTGTLTTSGSAADELIIYIDSAAGGFTDTSTLADTGGGSDTLRKGISGYDGTKRSTVDFTGGFAANFALAISPIGASFGGLFELSGGGATTSNFAFIQNANLTPTNANGPYTFSINLANLGIAPGQSFEFATTYLNSHSDIFRSNEALGNTITDVTNPGNTGSLGQDTGSIGFTTYTTSVPEPATWALMAGGASMLLIRRRRQAL